jgi:hypothetical protein
MILPKYQTHLNDVYEYIQNRTQAGVPPEELTNEVMSSYKMEVILPVDKDTLWDYVYVMCEQAYYYVNRTYYKV